MTIRPMSVNTPTPLTFAPAPPRVEVAPVSTSQDLAEIGGVRQGDYDYIGHMLAGAIGAGVGATIGGVAGSVAGAYLSAGSSALAGASATLLGGVGGVVVGGVIGATIAYQRSTHR